MQDLTDALFGGERVGEVIFEHRADQLIARPSGQNHHLLVHVGDGAECVRRHKRVDVGFNERASVELGIGQRLGQALFVGEDEIEHTPKNEVVRLNLGQAFDVTARSRQTDYQKLGESSYEIAFSVEIRNAKKQAITATVLETIPGEWKMVDESLPHASPTSSQAQWEVPVPAEGKTVLTYRVRTRL